ncbi:MAG: alpha-E domain-containing protein [Vulcanimicrobiota bacterium]
MADNLFWMGRYLARAEHTARVLDVQLDMALDRAPEEARKRWSRVLDTLSLELDPDDLLDNYRIVQKVTFDAQQLSSLRGSVRAARENARQIRELISSEMWEMLNRLYLGVEETRKNRRWIEEPHAFFREVKQQIHLFCGVTDSTMTRGQGWQFITAGRSIERAQAVSSLLRVTLAPSLDSHEPMVDEYLELVATLRSCTAFEAFCKVHSADLRPDPIAEFLLKNGGFPHSVRFSVETLCQALAAIAAETGVSASDFEHLARRTRASLEFRPLSEILERGLGSFLSWIESNLHEVHAGIYNVYISNPLRLAQEWEIG